mgnify:CR=1 FL=1
MSITINTTKLQYRDANNQFQNLSLVGDISKEAYTGDGLHINSEFLDGLNKEDAIKKMLEFLKEKDCIDIEEISIEFRLLVEYKDKEGKINKIYYKTTNYS